MVQVVETRQRDDMAARRYVGREGIVVADDRDLLPFGLAFVSDDPTSRAECYFSHTGT